MQYEINVSKNGRHYFATALRSLTFKTDALAMADHFREVFPESEGYQILVRSVETAYRDVQTEESGA